jgi:outer membrane lipoprotein carrier protein
MYRHKHTLKVTFLETYIENGQVTRQEAGIAYFLHPGKMRWEYAAPEKNLFIVDGKTAWFYVPADHTVTKIPARQSNDWRTPLALLAGEMKVSQFCKSIDFANEERPQTPENVVLSCVVRDGDSANGQLGRKKQTFEVAAESSIALFEVKRSSGELVRVIFHDPGGVRVQFQFSGWVLDQPMGHELFNFAPPFGVAIVEGDNAQTRP